MAGRFVRVRMYDVGFGDCLLIRFPGHDRDRTVLVDCGVHSASKGGHPLDVVIGDVIEQVRGPDGVPRIDVVVATHRHRDHVHGFRDHRWADVEVGEIWMPWTEDPGDADATRIRNAQSKRAALLLSLAASGGDGSDWKAAHAIAQNSDPLTNAAAMATLHAGFASSPTRHFLPEKPGHPAGQRSDSFISPVLPGVEVTILGPSRSEAQIRDLEPPAGGAYLSLDGGLDVERSGPQLPFDDLAMSEEFFRRRYGYLDIDSAELDAIVGASCEDALAMAVSLDKAVNGTSLMLLIRFESLSLLFPGDSEWGVWDRLMNDSERAKLLEGLALYKVAHHGSRNGTPIRFVQGYAHAGLAALVPVGPTDIPAWSDIPRPPMLEALTNSGVYVVRSDLWQTARDDTAGQKRAGVEATFAEDGLWSELALPLA